MAALLKFVLGFKCLSQVAVAILANDDNISHFKLLLKSKCVVYVTARLTLSVDINPEVICVHD